MLDKTDKNAGKNADKNFSVSVAMITYNHEAFVHKAIDGVLMQKTDFPIRLIIGEDLSTDRTREICLEYQSRFPEKIEVVCREKNLGVRRNFMETVQACEGKYVALCEGDDYWTDAGKLQRQIDFLENNQDFAVCHHRLEMVSGDEQNPRVTLSPFVGEVTTFEDLALRQHIMTASCVFRNKLFTFPEDLFLNVYSTDYTLHLLNANHGKIKLIDEVWGVYRMHEQGEWNGRDSAERAEKVVDTIHRCRDYFAPRGRAEFEFHATLMSCFSDFDQKKFKSFRQKCRRLAKRSSGFLSARNWSVLALRYFLSLFPRLTGYYEGTSARIKTTMKMR